MNSIKEIQLPEGFEVEKIENGKIILKESNPIDRLPNTWKEFCENNPIKKEYYINISSDIYEYDSTDALIRDSYKDKNLLQSEEACKAILALIQLIRLRDCYRMGWKPDWKDSKLKYCIDYYNDRLVKYNYGGPVQSIFSFQSEEVRNKFYDNFKDLLKQIKSLYE